MYGSFFWIPKTYPGKIGIMIRPSGPDFLPVELQLLKQGGTDVLVSLLTDEEIQSIGLEDEKRLSEELGMEFLHFPIPDRSIPGDHEKGLQFAQDLAHRLVEGENILLHCRKSIGRSPMMAAATLVWLGSSPRKAFQQIKKIRKAQVPDQPSQYRWVEEVERLRELQKPGSGQRSFLAKMLGY